MDEEGLDDEEQASVCPSVSVCVSACACLCVCVCDVMCVSPRCELACFQRDADRQQVGTHLHSIPWKVRGSPVLFVQ